MIRAISIDDEPHAHHVIRHHADKVPELELIESFTSPLKALQYLNEHSNIDLLFLDINMPDMDGISMLKTMKQPLMVIFTTAYEEYAVESYDFEALGYLLKPIEFPKFYQAVQRAIEKKQHRSSQQHSPQPPSRLDEPLYLKSGSLTLRILPANIHYIEASGNYAEVHCGDSQKSLVDYTLSELEVKLKADPFIRVHRSYLVNLRYVDVIERHQVQIGESQIPIGKTYREAFYEGLKGS